jgi:hypothetical protein
MVCETMQELEAREADAMDHIRLVCDRGKKGRWIEIFHAVRREMNAHLDECETCGEVSKAA